MKFFFCPADIATFKIRNIFKTNIILGLWNQIKDSRRVNNMLHIIISQIDLISLLHCILIMCLHALNLWYLVDYILI